MNVFEKITEQQKGTEGTAVYFVGEQLKDICRRNSKAAEMVCEDLDRAELSIAKCERKIKKLADEKHKQTKGDSVFVSPQEAEDIICKFYGIKADSKPVSLADLI